MSYGENIADNKQDYTTAEHSQRTAAQNGDIAKPGIATKEGDHGTGEGAAETLFASSMVPTTSFCYVMAAVALELVRRPKSGALPCILNRVQQHATTRDHWKD